MTKKNFIITKFTIITPVLIWLLYLDGTESVKSGRYLLALGLGAGLLLFICVQAITFLVRGETAIIIKEKRYVGWRFWWYVFLSSMLIGVVIVLIFTSTVDLTPQKTEIWRVVYNGRRTLKYFNPIDSRINRDTNEDILVLSRKGKNLFTHTLRTVSRATLLI